MKIFILLTIFSFVLFSAGFADENDCAASGCHQDLFQAEDIHPPMEEDCSSCHESNENKHPDSEGPEFTLSDEVPDLCYNCHDQKDNLTNVHPPVEEGACLDCHSPHSSQKDYLILGEKDESICMNCHDPDEGKVIHPPYEDRECTECHDPHQTIRPSLLKSERPELCFECHDDFREKLNMSSVHPAFEGDCLDCHNPHVSQVEYLLASRVPDLCFDCHESQSPSDSSKYKVHGVQKEGMPCMSCHDPHASENEPILKDDNAKVCLSCHSPGRLGVKWSAIDMASIIRNAKVTHPPLEDDGCLDCHQVHQEKFPYLLVAKFPATAYAVGKAENFALCFECHDSAIIKKRSRVTNFRNGKENLHAFHVNRQKGRSCALCHEVHGSKAPHLIADKVRFGEWKMPINYKATPNGGSCAPGCHIPKTYKR
ncbi:MAG: hypothetical protein GXO77_15395 [Calditrichaeota bacterium]|nr:hypothetical protein [Calditrichota bacterium]